MKNLILILIIGIIPAFLYGSDQDSTYQSLEQKIIQLEKRIESLEYHIDKIKPEKNLILWVIGLISAGLVLITVAFGLLIPAGLKMKYNKLKKWTTNEIKSANHRIIEVSTHANRAMYNFTLKNHNFMLVIWGGRWLYDLYLLHIEKPNLQRLIDMNYRLNEIYEELNTFQEKELKELANFINLGGVKKNYQTLEQFNISSLSGIITNEDKNIIKQIKETSTKILTKIYEIESNYKIKETYFDHPSYTEQ